MSTSASAPASTSRAADPRRAVPVLLTLFVFSLIIDNGFKFISKPMADDLGLSVATVSLQATLAGILIGIGAVVYATLADSVDIRRLLVAAIGMICLGSLLGFAGQRSFPLVLTGRIVQTAGLAAAETLYVIYVTKHLSAADQKTYLGYSTSCFQLSLLFGTLGGGFISDYLGWTGLFLVPLLSVLAVPVVLRTIPAEEHTRAHLDVIGLVLVAVFATGLMMFMQAFAVAWLIPVVIGLAAFAWHIRTHQDALITPAFFANRRYTGMLAVVFLTYSVQLGYGFMFPFLLSKVHGFDLSSVSLLLVPGYVAAALVGAFSGRIARHLSSRAAITTAITLIAVALALPAILMSGSVVPLVLSMVVFSSAFSLMYAPLLDTAVQGIPAERSGLAVGFYNLTINIAVPVGIAYTAKLIDAEPHVLDVLTTASGDTAASFANIMLVLAVVAGLGLVTYRVVIAAVERRERATATATPDAA